MFSALILCHRGRKGWEGEVCANGFGWTFSRKKAPFGSRSTCLFGTHAGFQTAACALGSVNERPPAIFFARRCCCAREGAAPAIENIPFLFLFCVVWSRTPWCHSGPSARTGSHQDALLFIPCILSPVSPGLCARRCACGSSHLLLFETHHPLSRRNALS